MGTLGFDTTWTRRGPPRNSPKKIMPMLSRSCMAPRLKKEPSLHSLSGLSFSPPTKKRKSMPKFPSLAKKRGRRGWVMKIEHNT